MPEKCNACGKTVYVTEKLTILNKIWHKTCFKCVTCGTTLTMKNYSAVGGKPYCKPHYPSPGSSNDPNAPPPEAGASYGNSNQGANQVLSNREEAPMGGMQKAQPPVQEYQEEPQYDQSQYAEGSYDYDPNY